MDSNKDKAIKPKVDKDKLEISKGIKKKALTENQIVTKDDKCNNTAGPRRKGTV